MIGQQHLQSRLAQLIENGTFPRFCIIVGPKGSGKKTLVNQIYQKFGIGIISNIGISVDAVRQGIAQSYAVRGDQAIYVFADADNMSLAAKNALLKVTEEPPNNSYFIMTLEDENNTLETIRSRGTVFHMDRYTPDEIYQYACDFAHCDTKSYKLFTSICETPGDVDILKKMGSKDFYDYVQLVVDNIAEVSLANAFKIPSKVALKEDAEGYDLRLFWKAFIKVIMDRACTHDDPRPVSQYAEAALFTSKCLSKLKTKGINKGMLLDIWVVEVRRLWV